MQTRTLIGNGERGFYQDGPTTGSARIAEPFGVTTGPDHAVYFCDLGNHRIRCLDDQGVRTVVGTGNPGLARSPVAALEADINEPYEVRFDSDGHLYFVDMKNHVVQRVDRRSGMVSVVAGTGEAGYSGDGGPAALALLNQPHSIEIDSHGGLFIADIGNHRLRKVDLQSGIIDTVAGNGETGPTDHGAPANTVSLFGPRAIAFDGQGNLVFALREGNAVYRIDWSTGMIQHLAGNGKFGYDPGDATASTARLAGPKGITVSADGLIYIADTESHTIRVIDPVADSIRTVVGDGTIHDGPDGDPLSCGLARPHGVFVDRGGRLLIGDTDNHRIRTLA
jgi:DNA-binding beta-propeller fold protein YncE